VAASALTLFEGTLSMLIDDAYRYVQHSLMQRAIQHLAQKDGVSPSITESRIRRAAR